MGRTVVLLEPGTAPGRPHLRRSREHRHRQQGRDRAASPAGSTSAWPRTTRRPEAWRQRDARGVSRALGHRQPGPRQVRPRGGAHRRRRRCGSSSPSVAEGSSARWRTRRASCVRFDAEARPRRGRREGTGRRSRSIRMESGRGLRGPDLRRRDLRGRPDGEGRRLLHRRPRGERRLRRDPQRRPDDAAPSATSSRSASTPGSVPGDPRERPPPRTPRRRPGRGGLGRPPRAGLQLPHDPDRRPREPPPHPEPEGYDPRRYELLRRYIEAGALRRPRTSTAPCPTARPT